MPLPPGEPGSEEAVSAWILEQARARDSFAHIYEASEEHRLQHGRDCDVYPSGSGPILGALAAATGANRILDVGCGLGYSALWLASGSSPDGLVATIEPDHGHAELAQRHFEQEGYGPRITIHEGRGSEVLPGLDGPYDIIYCDSSIDEYASYPDHFLRLLRPGGLLTSSNLFLGRHSPDITGLDQAAAYRQRILDDERLQTAFLPGGMALSVKTP